MKEDFHVGSLEPLKEAGAFESAWTADGRLVQNGTVIPNTPKIHETAALVGVTLALAARGHLARSPQAHDPTEA